jgi:hypothetical protein
MKKQIGVWLGFASIFLGVVLPAYILLFVIESAKLPLFISGLILLLAGVPIVFAGGYVGFGIALRLVDWGDKNSS